MDQHITFATIDTDADVAGAVAELIARDHRLAEIHAVTGQPPLRRSPPGLPSLLYMITEQMISLMAAAAIWQRVEARFAPFDPAHLANAPEEDYRACGLSGAKLNTMRALSSAILEGHLQLEALDRMDDETACAHLTAIKGIGNWTAQVYLLACHGRPDIWPAADVALQTAVQQVCKLDARPAAREMETIADDWRPLRAVAARLLWAHYRVIKGLPAA